MIQRLKPNVNMPQLSLINIQIIGGMKNEDLQMKILLRQNTELATKMQWYRKENQELKTKNEDLNTWVQNLSQVFSAVAASWQSITLMEETLLALIKKKSDMKDKTVLKKYSFHFKTFADIINNLGDKIKNTGHSDQVTLDAKAQLTSFVKNYEMLFKQFVDTYFKFNDQFSQLLVSINEKPDIQNLTRTLISKQLQNRQKIKEFQSYFESLKQNFKIFQDSNTHALMDGIIKEKESQIQKLKQTVYTLERRMKIMFDYNSLSVENQIEEKDFECICGGAQLSYMKTAWEKSMKSIGECKNGDKQRENGLEEEKQKTKVDEEKYLILQEEKETLISRNKLLLEKIDKMKIQFKLTDSMVLKSNVYSILRDQCQYLMDYITDLLAKLKKNQELLVSLQRSRDEEIRELKKKIEKSKLSSERVSSSHLIQSHHSNMDLPFKTQALKLIRQLKLSYDELGKKAIRPEETMVAFKSMYSQVKKDNEELNKKLDQCYARELSKSDVAEFKHEKYKIIEIEVSQVLEAKESSQKQLWRQFINYAKNRDKKIKDLESLLRKKERQVTQKTKIEEMMKINLSETESVYMENKEKLDKTESFINRMEKELASLSQEIFNKKTEYEQQKNLLTLRLKAETEARNKLEEKITLFSRIEAQMNQMRQNENQLQINYQAWLQNQKAALEASQKQSLEKSLIIKSLTEETSEKDKQLSKLQGEKQSLKSDIRQLQNKVDLLLQKSEDEALKIELEEYKGKIMCTCKCDREREVVLKTCPHLFCKKCIDDTTSNRNRKCPLCGIRFTKTDIHEIKWS